MLAKHGVKKFDGLGVSLVRFEHDPTPVRHMITPELLEAVHEAGVSPDHPAVARVQRELDQHAKDALTAAGAEGDVDDDEADLFPDG